jgi:hypothetical protein
VALATYKKFCPQWHKPADKLTESDEDHVDCLVKKNGAVMIRPWNTRFKCFDTEDYDDHFCEPNEAEWWTYLAYPPEC